MRFAGRRKIRLAEGRYHIRMLGRHQCVAIHGSRARYSTGWHAYGSGGMACTGLLCLLEEVFWVAAAETPARSNIKAKNDLTWSISVLPPIRE